MNPLIAIRKNHNLTCAQLAVLCHVSSNTIQRIESGSLITITPRVLHGLEILGYDSDKFVEEYSNWKKEQNKKILASLQDGGV